MQKKYKALNTVSPNGVYASICDSGRESQEHESVSQGKISDILTEAQILSFGGSFTSTSTNVRARRVQTKSNRKMEINM